MKNRSLGLLMLGVLLLPLTSCVEPFFTRANASSDTPDIAEVEDGLSSLPLTKSTTVNLDGEISEVELVLYDEVELPLGVYVPSNGVQAETVGSESAAEVRFHLEVQNSVNPEADPVNEDDVFPQSYIHFVFPNGKVNAEDMQNLVLGDSGLLSANGWEIVDRTNVVTYPWALEKIVYQSSSGVEGAIFIGENRISDRESEFFLIFSHIPTEYASNLAPTTTLILENIEFLDDFF